MTILRKRYKQAPKVKPVAFSSKIGKLDVCLCKEILPGDEINLSSRSMTRLTALDVPFFGRIQRRTKYYFVRNRNLWDEHDDYVTMSHNGKPLSDGDMPVYPKITIPQTGFPIGSLGDFVYGVPGAEYKGKQVSALPFRAVMDIWNLYHRHEWLQDEYEFPHDGGDDTFAYPNELYANFRRDYFTSALPSPQKGDPVIVPVTGSAPVVPVSSNATVNVHNSQSIGNHGILIKNKTTTTGNIVGDDGSSTVKWDANTGLQADIANTAGISVDEFRLSVAVQQVRQLMARYGSYIHEYISGLFGIRTSLAAAHLPEYLGGWDTPIHVTEVLQTSASESQQPLGNYGGHGIGMMQSDTIYRKFDDYGWLIGITWVDVMPHYGQGIARQFTRFSPYDVPNPAYQHLGEQAIKVRELAAYATNGDDDWGYAQRYSELYNEVPEVHGQFLNTLRQWTTMRKFDSSKPAPALNSDFLKHDKYSYLFPVNQDEPDADPIFSVIEHDITWTRAFNPNATPGYMDHAV